jgi:glycosyltransferase involved in cell wall biosynthesis
MKKILVVTSERITGLNYHRQITPFFNLKGFDIEYKRFLTPEEVLGGYCDSFDCVSFLRLINKQGRTEEMVNYLKAKGIKIHFDIDDYWVLPSNHALFEGYKKERIAQQVIEALKSADFVTTTTDKLAQVISQHNKNIYVLPNAIDPTHEQWTNATLPSDKLRFGYIAGVHHEKDAEILYDNLNLLYFEKELKGKYQICAAGFNISKYGDKHYVNPYYQYLEQLFTNNYKHLPKEYEDYLMQYVPDNNYDYNDIYRRLWGMDTVNYGKSYNFIDVSLIPLRETLFSSCKSQLKVIEAGFMKKACIVSNVQPYTLDCNSDNSILIEPNKNGRGWYKAMKKLIENPNMVTDLGEAMYETVKDKYHIENVNIVRKQIFEQWIK